MDTLVHELYCHQFDVQLLPCWCKVATI